MPHLRLGLVAGSADLVERCAVSFEWDCLRVGVASQAAALAAHADAVVVCETPFGSANLANLEVAVESGRPLVLIGSIEGRDFAGGEAARLWSQALESGAIVADDHDGAVRALEELVGREE